MSDSARPARALITGASGDIGWGIARHLTETHPHIRLVLHCYSNREDLETRLRDAPMMNAEILQADLREPSACIKLVAEASKRLEGLDLLVCNAGAVYEAVPFQEVTPDAWEETLALNCSAPFHLAQTAYGLMERTGGGRIILISSISVKYGGGSTTLHYAAAKAGAEVAMQGMARSGAEKGILLNIVRGGFIDTAFHQKLGRSEEQLRERIRLIPRGRAGRVEEVAAMVTFLAGPEADFISGEIFTVAGGD